MSCTMLLVYAGSGVGGTESVPGSSVKLVLSWGFRDSFNAQGHSCGYCYPGVSVLIAMFKVIRMVSVILEIL